MNYRKTGNSFRRCIHDRQLQIAALDYTDVMPDMLVEQRAVRRNDDERIAQRAQMARVQPQHTI